MRILWLSPITLSDNDSGSGSWIRAMAKGLHYSGHITLGNITVAPLQKTLRQDHGEIAQWIVPGILRSTSNYFPPDSVIDDIVNAASEFQPDIIHVWGTEYFFGLLTARKYLEYPSLLEIQGLKGPISRLYAGGLTFKEIIACIGIREVLQRSTIFQRKKNFVKWAFIENEIINKHKNISTQSRWVDAWVKKTNPSCKLFHNELALRDIFYKSDPWKSFSEPIIFTSSAAPGPFKGLHDAVRAVAILRERVPTIKLRIAGAHQKNGIRRNGYINWINKLIKKYNLSTNVEWLGQLNSYEIVKELTNCAVALVPSHCESYCVALAEAEMLGTPIVTSFTGGTAWLAEDNKSALFYPAGDEVMCAHQIFRLLSEEKLAKSISKNARAVALSRNNKEEIINNQINIYKSILKLGN